LTVLPSQRRATQTFKCMVLLNFHLKGHWPWPQRWSLNLSESFTYNFCTVCEKIKSFTHVRFSLKLNAKNDNRLHLSGASLIIKSTTIEVDTNAIYSMHFVTILITLAHINCYTAQTVRTCQIND